MENSTENGVSVSDHIHHWLPTGHWVEDAIFVMHFLLQFYCAKEMVELCQDKSSKIQVAAWYFLEV